MTTPSRIAWAAALILGLGSSTYLWAGPTTTAPAAVTVVATCGVGVTETHGVLTVDTAGVLCTDASVASGTFSSTATAITSLPTLSPGSQTPTASLAGAQYVQPVFGSASGGGTQVDATHGLPSSLLDGSPAHNPVITCNSSAVYDASTSGKTQLVALSSGKVIYVCGITLMTGGTATNVGLVYGTGSNCASGETAVTPAFQLTANQPLVVESATWNGLATAASNELCVKTSAGNPVQALVKYTQQ